MTPLPLTPEQIRTLQETGEVETWDAAAKQPSETEAAGHIVADLLPYFTGEPKFGYAYYWKGGSCWNSSGPQQPPHPIGTQAWVQEQWCEYARLLPSDDHGKVHYHADDAHEAVKPWGNLEWQPASTMPQWASRFTLISTAVRVERREGVWGFCTTWRRV